MYRKWGFIMNLQYKYTTYLELEFKLNDKVYVISERDKFGGLISSKLK